MPRPFRKGIACHGSMPVCPFSQDRFVALDNDDIISKNEHYLMVGYALLTTSHLGKLHKTSEMKYKLCMQKYKVKSKATLIYAPVLFLFFFFK